MRIVGVFKDFPHQPWATPRPLFALTQANSRVTYHVRAEGDPRSIRDTLESAVRDPNNEFVAQEIQFFTEAQDRALRNERSALMVLGTLAATALFLSSVGIWYTTRQLVRQSQKEMSIRLAIGATPASLLKLVVKRSMQLAVSGLALGVALSYVTNIWIRNSINGIDSFEPVPYLATLFILFTVAFVASYLPARTATRAGPKDALSEV